jgi:hypothetical protein
MREETAVKIMHRPTKTLVPATLVTGLSIREAQLAQSSWQYSLEQVLKNIPKKEWPQHAGWDWEVKYKKYGRLSAFTFCGIKCDGKVQGLLLQSTLLRTSKMKELDGKQVVYALYLASAPWNLRSLTSAPIYALVGSVLVAKMIELSINEH